MIHVRSLTKNHSYSNLVKYNSYALQNTRTVLLRSELHRLLHFLSRTLHWHSSEQQGYSVSYPSHNQNWNYNLCTHHRLHNEQLNSLYCSPNIIRVIKSRGMRWEQVARMGRGQQHKGFWWGKHRDDHCEDLRGSSSSDIRSSDWIDLAQSRERWRDLVNAITNFRVG